MDFLQAIIDLLRGTSDKKPAPEDTTSDEASSDFAAGFSAVTDPAYAAYVREAKAMGETPLGKAEWRKQNADNGGY